MSASVFPFGPNMTPFPKSTPDAEPDPFGDECDEAIGAFRAKLTEEKGLFWTRKVLFACAMKTSMHMIEGPQSTKSAMHSVIASDILQDLSEHFPNREPLDIGKELIADCEALFAQVI